MQDVVDKKTMQNLADKKPEAVSMPKEMDPDIYGIKWRQVPPPPTQG